MEGINIWKTLIYGRHKYIEGIKHDFNIWKALIYERH